MQRILVLYALSGFISLGYQVAWFRLFTDWFGSTSLTFAIVVTAFIGGLATGALASSRITAGLLTRLRLADRLRACGAVELLIASALVLTAAAAAVQDQLWGTFPYALQAGVWVPTAGYALGQMAVAALCVFLPCVLMGVTYPLLCDTVRRRRPEARFPSALYAANTLGACLGILASQFLLLPWLGHATMLAVLVGANVVLGLCFLTLGDERAWLGEAGESLHRGHGGRPGNPAGYDQRTLFALGTLAGLAAGSLEGDLFRRISFVIELNPGATMAVVSFWAVLAIFVASTLVTRLPALRLVHIQWAFAAAVAYGLATWTFVDDILDVVERTLAFQDVGLAVTLEGGLNLIFPANFAQLFTFVGVLVFPPYLLVSLLLPLVCNLLGDQDRRIGIAYGLNTLGFCAGLVGFTLVAPSLNIFYSFRLFPAFLAIIVLCLLAIRLDRALPAWLAAAGVSAATAAMLLTPRDFSPEFFRPETEPATARVTAVRSNAATTTFVVNSAGVSRLYFGRLSMSSTNHASRVYMRLMAHFPLLAHPNPHKALVICFGVGNTAGAIAAHETIAGLDVVDLNGNVFETATEFAATNGNVTADPRVRLIRDDGRNFLDLTDERYDLITSEPPPPLAAGVDRLYSRQYYASVLAHLTPGGLMSQWLPTHLMPPAAVELAVATFLDVFPHALLLTGFGTDFILVGSPAAIDLGELERRFAGSPAVRADLASLNIDNPTELLGRIVQTDAELRRRYAAHPTIDDRRNTLEQLLPQPGRRPVIAYNPNAVLASLAPFQLASFDDLQRVLTHLGRLRYRVENFPLETLGTVRASGATGVQLADADWARLGELFTVTLRASGTGDAALMARTLTEFLSVAEEQPEVLVGLAELALAARQYPAAVDLVARAEAIEPGDPVAQVLWGRALMWSGRSPEALERFASAARARPTAWEPAYRMAWIRAAHPDPALRDPAEALRLARLAAQLAGPGNVATLKALAAAHAAAGDFEQAVAIGGEAVQRAGQAGDPGAQSLRSQVQAYGRGQSVVDQSLAAGPAG